MLNQTLSSGSDSAAWAQVWISAVAIIASGLIATMVPVWQEYVKEVKANVNRLVITTQHLAGDDSSPGPLGVTLLYTPREMHQGIVARISVPGGGPGLNAGKRLEARLPSGLRDIDMVGEEDAVSLELVFAPSPFEAPGILECACVISGNWQHIHPQAIKMQIDLLFQIDRILLLRRSFVASPIDYRPPDYQPYPGWRGYRFRAASKKLDRQ